MIQNALPALGLLILMVALAWLLQRYRRHLPGVASHTGPGLQLMNSLSLGPQQRIVTVQVDQGGERICLVLGVAPGSVTALHSLPLPALPGNTPETGSPGQPAGGFAARLAQLTQPQGRAPHAPR